MMLNHQHRVSIGILFLVLITTIVGCGGSGGGGSQGRLTLLSVSAETGPELPWDGFFLNERLILQFSSEIDPTSVNPDSIQIRIKSTSFTIAAEGDFVIEGDTILFVPKFPSAIDLSDGGFQASTEYRVLLPGFPDQQSIRSTSGNILTDTVSTTFETRSNDPLLLDPVPGRPRVTTIALDLNRDGIFDADGIPETPDPEEFTDLDSIPLVAEVPVGLARAPMKVGVFLNEPILPASLFEDLDDDGQPDSIALVNPGSATKIPTLINLEQSFLAQEDRFRTLITVSPRATLPPRSEVQIQIFNLIRDFGFPSIPINPLTAGFTTQTGPATFVDEIAEDFDTTINRSSSSTADWGLRNSGVLVPGSGLGGSPVDGTLFVPASSTFRFNTAINQGIYQFDSVLIEEDSQVRAEGPHPLQIFCRGDFDLRGNIILDGERGENGATNGASRVVVGGLGGPGGFRGGNANDPPGRSINTGKDGFAPSFFPDSGGKGGRRATASIGGGGGGGHADPGGQDPISNSGAGGAAYDIEPTLDLNGGSGGAGGGNGANGNPLLETPGGAGGGGGGAFILNCAGTFRFTGDILSADGGGGGDGANSSPSAPAPRGGGGGGAGSGGVVRIFAATIDDIETRNARLSAAGGRRGSGGSGAGARPGGHGSPGRIFLATIDKNQDGIPNDFLINQTAVTVDPQPEVEILDEKLLRESVALSTFFFTGSRFPRYSFDGNDPLTGEAILDGTAEDLVFKDTVAEGVKVLIHFEGAQVDPDNSSRADPETVTGFVSDVRDLNGFELIRFRITFDLGPDFATIEKPIVTKIRIPFQFDI